MKFLVDAQLPRRMCLWLAAAGHDARHSSELPMANRTPDADLIEIADAYYNTRLQALIEETLPQIELGFGNATFVELSRTHLAVRG